MPTRTHRKPSRTAIARPSRGTAVVSRVLDAAVEELARSGYAAMKVEDVAQAAGVNKTTVYRRWPTKDALVRAALLSRAEEAGTFTIPDSGSLEGDLMALVEQQLRFTRSCEGSAIVRVLHEASADPDVVAITRALRATKDVVLRSLLERARARRELRPDADLELFHEVLQLALDRAHLARGSATPRYVKGVLSLLLRGVLRR